MNSFKRFAKIAYLTSVETQAAILTDIGEAPVYLSGETLPTAGSADFDSDLISIATADYATASTDFTNYLDSLSSLGSRDTTTGLTAILTELDTAYTADIGALSTDLTNIFGDLGGSTSGEGVNTPGTLLVDLASGLI
jgi:hypothetical protein